MSLPRRASLLVPLLSDAPNEPFDLDTLLAGYAAAAAPFDEMLVGDGTIRPHWRTFVDGFAALGPEGRAAAGESTRRLLRESGIAFNVYADPDDRQHAWRLDLVPVLLPEQEWDVLAAGILQRARLIDAVLADLHGEQTLVRDGSLPASLLLGSPAFVRTSVERDGPPRRFLYAYACDVARTAAGGWVVLGDQTDTAIGNGYVLASRVALSHGLAEL
ncbi:MAG: circularly permuted type 2 ATP-grasp protein, partial [Microvirga sp.]